MSLLHKSTVNSVNHHFYPWDFNPSTVYSLVHCHAKVPAGPRPRPWAKRASSGRPHWLGLKKCSSKMNDDMKWLRMVEWLLYTGGDFIYIYVCVCVSIYIYIDIMMSTRSYNVAIPNPLEMKVLMGKSSNNRECSIAMILRGDNGWSSLSRLKIAILGIPCFPTHPYPDDWVITPGVKRSSRSFKFKAA